MISTQMKVNNFEMLFWKLRNRIRPGFWIGGLFVLFAKFLTWFTGIPTITSRLSAKLIRNGKVYNLGPLGFKVVTTAGVGYIVDAWQGSVSLSAMKYHTCGTSSVAEAVSDTALGAECTNVINPDSTRSAGSLSESAYNILQTTANITFDGSASLREHGLLNASSGGVLFDRTVFAAVPVIASDIMQFTYTCTFNSGG